MSFASSQVKSSSKQVLQGVVPREREGSGDRLYLYLFYARSTSKVCFFSEGNSVVVVVA
jgi:hypothetical protein